MPGATAYFASAPAARATCKKGRNLTYCSREHSLTRNDT